MTHATDDAVRLAAVASEGTMPASVAVAVGPAHASVVRESAVGATGGATRDVVVTGGAMRAAFATDDAMRVAVTTVTTDAATRPPCPL